MIIRKHNCDLPNAFRLKNLRQFALQTGQPGFLYIVNKITIKLTLNQN